MSSETLLRARGVELAYRRREVLRGVDLDLHAGEVVALLGPNGAGKTTLMKVLVGLLDSRAGEVQAPAGRMIGWVPQGGATWQRLTVRENLELFTRLLRLPGDVAEIASSAAHAARLEPWFETLGSDLSGGLRQRLNVAVGLLGDPALLVLDEPTTGVDLEHRTELFRVLRAHASAGGGVLVSTHSVEEAELADRVVVIVGGRDVHTGTLADVADETGDVPAGLLRLWATPEAVAQ